MVRASTTPLAHKTTTDVVLTGHNEIIDRVNDLDANGDLAPTFDYQQTTDPGAVGAGKTWLNTTDPPPYQANVRNALDTAWNQIGSVSGGSGGTEYTEDAAAPASPQGGALLLRINEALADLVDADGDWVAAAGDRKGRVVFAPITITLSGRDFIGLTGYDLREIVPAIVVSTSAYATGNVIGSTGKYTLTNAMGVASGGGGLDSVVVVCAANIQPAFDIILFNASPIGTFTDRTAVTWNTADFAKIIGHVHVDATNWLTVNARNVKTVANIGLDLKANGSQNLYAVLIAAGAFTFAATSDLTVRFGLRAF